MNRRRPARAARTVVAVLSAVVVPVAVSALGGCARAVEGVPHAASRADLPGSVEQLERYVVQDVPSGLPRLPDHQLDPPAGPKTMEDVAGYATNPGREREVLRDYGYRFGWERFWGHDGGPITGVFVDRFDSRRGAAAYAEDLATNDAERYGGMLREDPPHLPGGCRLLGVESPEPGGGLSGPAAFAWCSHGVFSVSVSAVADSVTAASDEVHAVMQAQLRRLPPG